MVNLLLSSNNFHEKWAKETLKPYFDKRHTVAIIPFSFNSSEIQNDSDWQSAYHPSFGKYYQSIVTPFIELGIHEANIKWLNYFTHTSGEMIKMVEESEIIFLTGGLPDQAVERVIEKGLLDSLNQSQMVIGMSAGALMQLQNYHLSPDKDYPEFIYSKGLGLLHSDFYIEVHYEGTAIQKECIKKVLAEKANTVYAISNQGGLLIDHNNLHLLGDVITFKGESI